MYWETLVDHTCVSLLIVHVDVPQRRETEQGNSPIEQLGLPGRRIEPESNIRSLFHAYTLRKEGQLR